MGKTSTGSLPEKKKCRKKADRPPAKRRALILKTEPGKERKKRPFSALLQRGRRVFYFYWEEDKFLEELNKYVETVNVTFNKPYKEENRNG